jgi:hypothetical protein
VPVRASYVSLEVMGRPLCSPIKKDARFSPRTLRSLEAPEDDWVVNRFLVYIQLFGVVVREEYSGGEGENAHSFGGSTELGKTLREPDGSMSTILTVFRAAGDARNGDEFR